MTSNTPPSGESAPPSLPTETILEAELRHHADTIASNGAPSVMYEHLDQADDELARLRAEVARLTAERDTLARVAGLAEARAARAEEALYRDESVRGAMDDFEGNRADLDAMYQAKDWHPAYATDYIRELSDLYRDLGSTVAAIYHYRAPAGLPAAPRPHRRSRLMSKPIMAMKLAERLNRIAAIIEAVDNRCAAADGPVTPTSAEITQAECSEIYALASCPPLVVSEDGCREIVSNLRASTGSDHAEH